MKRDLDLIREILRAQRDSGHRHVTADEFTEYDHDDVVGHMELLQDQGFVEASIHRVLAGKPYAHTIRLTSRGHDFLDATENSQVWEAVKLASAKVGGVGLVVLTELAKAEVKRRLGLP